MPTADPGMGFVGRARDLAMLGQRAREAADGRGCMVTVTGEAGIGKTRLLHEFAVRVSREQTVVLSGSCWEERGTPYGPFREALEGYVAATDAALLRTEMGAHAGVIAHLVPRVRERLPETVEPVALQPDEERSRLLDGVSQFLAAIATRASVVLLLDDLHWADEDSIALLRHVARTIERDRLMLVGAYRAGEVDDAGPLADALGVLSRQPGLEQLGLQGLALDEVGQLVQVSAAARGAGSIDCTVDAALVSAILSQTRGNPFFVRLMVRHLTEEGTIRIDGGAWRASVPLDEIGVPQGVRHVLRRRLRRLSEPAQQLLTVASAVGASFRFDVVAEAAEQPEERALELIDEALAADLVAEARAPDSYDFVHALVRHTLYESMNPSRRVRLHRRIADAMERVYAARATEHAAELAIHFHRSRTLRGAEHGVAYAIHAADQAERSAAREEVVRLLRLALDLLPASDPRRPRLLARLGMALAWAASFDAALKTAIEAARLIGASEGDDAAAECLAAVLAPLWEGAGFGSAFALASRGLQYAGARRDMTWVSLMAMEIIRREIEAIDNPMVRLDVPERREVIRALTLGGADTELLKVSTVPSHVRIFLSESRGESWHSGDYRGGVTADRRAAAAWEEEGRIAEAAYCWASAFRSHTALGQLASADEARQRAVALVARAPNQSALLGQVGAGDDELRMVRDEGWDTALQGPAPDVVLGPLHTWFRVGLLSVFAKMCARLGNEQAVTFLPAVLAGLADPPSWMLGAPYVKVACDAAEVLWLTGCTDHIAALESHLRERVVDRDLHHPMMDGRLALARLSALHGRHDRAAEWFDDARSVLDRQGARPLRAVVDYDEALMYARRGADGDRARAVPLTEAALAQFQAVGMPGWIRRAENLLRDEREGAPAAAPRTAPEQRGTEAADQRTAPQSKGADARSPRHIFRREGHYWTIVYADVRVQLKDSKGLHYIAHLLRHPSHDFLALDLIGDGTRAEGGSNGEDRPSGNDLGPLLDASAKHAYEARLGDLREELAEATRFNDLGRVETLQAEMGFIVEQLHAAVGLGGRDRKAGSASERARLMVTKRIKDVMKALAQFHPALAHHLRACVKTGTYCTYTPPPGDPVVWQL